MDLRALCFRLQPVRSQIVVCHQSYSQSPDVLLASLLKGGTLKPSPVLAPTRVHGNLGYARPQHIGQSINPVLEDVIEGVKVVSRHDRLGKTQGTIGVDNVGNGAKAIGILRSAHFGNSEFL